MPFDPILVSLSHGMCNEMVRIPWALKTKSMVGFSYKAHSQIGITVSMTPSPLVDKRSRALRQVLAGLGEAIKHQDEYEAY